MLEIIVPTAVATIATVLLAAAVLATRHWLLPRGSVGIRINGHASVRVPAGERLLLALAQCGVYLPAACGGRGTCGQCRVTVESGAPRLLPTETVHISRREALSGARLACMLTVRADMAIRVDEDLLDARRWRCRIESTDWLTPTLKRLCLGVPGAEGIDFEAGDYVLVEAPPHDVMFDRLEIPTRYRDQWLRHRLLELRSTTSAAVTRAYSLANPPQDRSHAVLVVRIAPPPGSAPPGTPPGAASSYLCSLRVGDEVTVSGPFGRFHAQPSNLEMVLIAGGAGIAPIRSIVLDQLARGSKRTMGLWYGARSADELCFDIEFRELARTHANFTYHAAISEASVMPDPPRLTGFIHRVVYENYLREHPAPEELEYYLCGPPLMSAAVIQELDSLGVDDANIRLDDFGA